MQVQRLNLDRHTRQQQQIFHTKESDASLPAGISKELGMAIKITMDKIIIFDEKTYEDKEIVITFDKSDLKRYNPSV